MNPRNKNIGLTICLFLLGNIFLLSAQQLPIRNAFGATGFLWNPAMTAFDNEWEAGLSHHQSWVGFDDAPQSTAIYGQYPFEKQAASIGGFLLLDEIKPIRNNVIGLTYAYKLNFGSKGNRRKSRSPRQNGQLSIGVMLAIHQFFVRGGDFTVQHTDDPLEPIGELNEFSSNIGAGVFYASRLAGKNSKSYFYAGLGSNQLIPRDLLVKEGELVGNLRQIFHANASLGYRSVGDQFIIEPSVWFNLGAKNILNTQLNLKFEHTKAFWASIHYSLNQTLGIQIGYKLPGTFGDDSQLLIGVLGDFNLGSFGAERGLGYGFYIAYKGIQ